MNQRRITFEMLNGYVDGELDALDAAEVARAVADDTGLAREVAALSRLRAALTDGSAAPDLALPPPARSARLGGGAIAACIGFALFVAGSVLLSSVERNAGSAWLDRAWAMHRGWSIDAGAGAATRSALMLAQFVDAVPGAYVPDLTASRLSLVNTATQRFIGQRQALLAGYRGSRGCKITLVVFPSPSALSELLADFRDAGNEAYGWRAGELGYVLMSDGMDSARFRLLAESVRRASRQHLPFDEGTRTALRTSRDTSAPCPT